MSWRFSWKMSSGMLWRTLNTRNGTSLPLWTSCMLWDDKAELFSICSAWSLTHCHSWNNLPCIQQQFFVIASCYRPPATTISLFSYTSSSPVKKSRSSNRLGTAGGWEARRAFGPSTDYRNQDKEWETIMHLILLHADYVNKEYQYGLFQYINI